MDLRRELARLRGAALGRSESPDGAGKGVKTSISDVAMEAFGASSPIDADELLELARWRRLESLEYGEYFNLEWLALYCLKLQIMERRGSFDPQMGMGCIDSALKAARDTYENEGVSDAA